MLRREPWEKRKNFSFEWTSTPRDGELILGLTEIRRVSFYQRVMETQ